MREKRGALARAQAREHLREGIRGRTLRATAFAREGAIKTASSIGNAALIWGVIGIALAMLVASPMLFFAVVAAGLDALTGRPSGGDDLTRFAHGPSGQWAALMLFAVLPALGLLGSAAWERSRPAPGGLAREGALAEGLSWKWVTHSDRLVRSAIRRCWKWGWRVCERVQNSGRAGDLIPALGAWLALPPVALVLFSCVAPGALLAAAGSLRDTGREIAESLRAKGLRDRASEAWGGVGARARAAQDKWRRALDTLEREGAASESFRARQKRELERAARPAARASAKKGRL